MENKQNTIQREDIINVANSIGKHISDNDIDYIMKEINNRSDEDMWYILVEDMIYSLDNR